MTCAATVEAATTAHRASTMEAVPAVEVITSADFIAAPRSTAEPFVPMESVVNVTVMIPTTAVIPVATAIVTAAIIRAAVEAMEPRAGADEYSVHEVIRAPIAVRRAIIRLIIVISVIANRRSPIITVIPTIVGATVVRTHAHCGLCIRVASSKKQNAKQRSVLYISHFLSFSDQFQNAVRKALRRI